MTTPGERPGFEAICDGATTLGLDPAELLGRFAATRDEAAFAALVALHGPMVLATCRRIIPHRADADDAFQATFLVLARRARAIHDPDRLAPWLHRVARHVALRARGRAARRRLDGAGDDEVAILDPPAELGELRAVLDEELARLPEKYRAPLVLCYLEGLTHDQAAGQLKWPVGTVRSRLAGGRDRLRGRLARRGFAPGSIGLPAPLPLAAVSGPLRVATVRLALATPLHSAAAPAAILAQGALTAMLTTKLQTAALATLAVAATLAAGTAGVVLARQQAAPQSAPGAAPPPARIAPDAGAESPEEELYRRTQALNQLGAQAARATGPARADLDEKLKQATQRFWSARLNGEVANNYAWEMTGVPGKLQSQIGRAEVFVKELTGELDAAKGRVKALRAELSAWQAKHQPSEANFAIGAAGAIAQQPSADVPKVGPPSPTAADPPEVAALIARVQVLEAELARRDERDEQDKAREARAKASDGAVEAMRDAAGRLDARPEAPKGVPQQVAELEKQPEALRKAGEDLNLGVAPAEPARGAMRLAPIGGDPDLVAPSRPTVGGKEVSPDRPEATPTMETLPGSPTILMITSAARDRIVMIDPTTQRRAVLRFDQAVRSVRAVAVAGLMRPATPSRGGAAEQVEAQKRIDGLVGLHLIGPKITKAALFDRRSMQWLVHDLPGPSTFVYPASTPDSTLIGFNVKYLAPTREVIAFDAKDQTWPVVTFPEPVSGLILADVSNFGTVSYDAGRLLGIYSQAARKATVLNLEHPAPRRPDPQFASVINFQWSRATGFNPGLSRFHDGKLIIQDGNLIHFYDPRTAISTRIDTEEDR